MPLNIPVSLSLRTWLGLGIAFALLISLQIKGLILFLTGWLLGGAEQFEAVRAHVVSRWRAYRRPSSPVE